MTKVWRRVVSATRPTMGDSIARALSGSRPAAVFRAPNPAYQAVEIEVRAPLGALDDVVDLEAGAHLRRRADPRLCRLDHRRPTLE